MLPPTYVEGFHDVEAVKQMRYNQLGNTGLQMSHMSLGGAALGGVYGDVAEKDACKVLREALRLGINYIDTAPWYGDTKSEIVLGKALRDISRHAYFLGTKVGRYRPQVEKMFDFRAERVIQSVDESLSRLGLPYVDIIQVHDFEFAPSLDMIVNETLPALQKVVSAGKARFIGITGYPLQPFHYILEKSQVKIDAVLSYCRCNLYDNELQRHIDYFQSRGLGVINAAPVAMGMLSSQGPSEWHPAHPVIKEACSNAVSFCKERGIELAKLAVHYTLSQPGPATHLISCNEVALLKKNLETYYNGLTPVEEQALQEVLDRYMNPLPVHHWEGVDVEKYWRDRKMQADGKEPRSREDNER